MIAAAAFCFWCAAHAAAIIESDVIRVVDGDTLIVRARIWPQHFVETTIRLRGIDAPEFPGRCEAEAELAQRAKARLAELAGRLIANPPGGEWAIGLCRWTIGVILIPRQAVEDRNEDEAAMNIMVAALRPRLEEARG